MIDRGMLWTAALEDLGSECSVDTTLDIEYVKGRIAAEGESFLTTTLPQFGKDFERSLEDLSIAKTSFTGFGRRERMICVTPDRIKTSGGIPKFLSGFLQIVFDDSYDVTRDELNQLRGIVAGHNSQIRSREWSESQEDASTYIYLGDLLPPLARPVGGLSEDEESKIADAIAAIRQLCLMFGKEKSICSDHLVQAAVEEFARTDEELIDPFFDGRVDLILTSGKLDRIKKVITHAFGDVFSKVDKLIHDGNITPKHGPGATADSLIGNQKWLFNEWTERLEVLFPFVDFCLPNYSWWEEVQDVAFLTPSEERPVKLMAVPKTQSTPRLIAVEPTAMQYMQQAIRVPLCSLIEESPIVGPMIGFTDQDPNRWMARIGSEDKSLATLDLSEASDRIGNWIVESLFEDFPFLSEALQATRSRSVCLPSGEVIQLQKFASMGSALTFPIEAIIFLAVTIEAVLSVSGRRISTRSIMALHDQVRVFGDDIIVPEHSTETVIESLELFGFKVNRHKSFWNGWFRESCGEEFWRGHDVSIVRSRREIPQSRRDVAELVSLIEMRNHFASSETVFPTLVDLIDAHVESLLGFFPWVLSTSPVLGRVHPSGLYQIDTVGRNHHSPLVKGYVLKPKIPQNSVDGRPALMKCLSTTIGMQDVDVRHLQRSGRPQAVSMKLGMARPF